MALVAHLPSLPNPPSWFPGHMVKFTRMLPGLLNRTNVVLEIRDSRLPLTSINPALEGALRKWRLERGWDPRNTGKRLHNSAGACEHLVVFNKRDLVPEWGIQPFCKAMAKKFPHQRVLFASWHRPRDIRGLSEILVNIAKEYPHSLELNVLVVGMPNVGKSTLLNALRNIGIKGPTPKAFQTSAKPGMTRSLSTRLKLCLDPTVYAYDSPGIMLPYLGQGEEGAERGVKLALIAGIKEGLYSVETLAAYLLYRLNVINPTEPAYLNLLPKESSPTNDLFTFLDLLAKRMNMMKRGGMTDIERAAVYFIKWWREEGGLLSASSASLSPESDGTTLERRSTNLEYPLQQAWGFDFQWTLESDGVYPSVDQSGAPGGDDASPDIRMVQDKMEECIEEYIKREETEQTVVSPTQIKKRLVLAEKQRRKAKSIAKRNR